MLGHGGEDGIRNLPYADHSGSQGRTIPLSELQEAQAYASTSTTLWILFHSSFSGHARCAMVAVQAAALSLIRPCPPSC